MLEACRTETHEAICYEAQSNICPYDALRYSLPFHPQCPAHEAAVPPSILSRNLSFFIGDSQLLCCKRAGLSLESETFHPSCNALLALKRNCVRRSA